MYGVSYKQQNFISHSPKGQRLRPRPWHGCVQLMHSHWVLTWWKQARALSGAPVIKALTPLRHLTKAPPPNVATWGLGFQHINLGEHIHSDNSPI